MKLFLAIFSLVPLIFMGVGGYLAWDQHHKITTFQPVPAVVLSKEVHISRSTNSKGRTHTSYKPVVRYRYEVQGRTYVGEKITPMNESRSSRWAHAVINRYAINQKVEAYCNPADPSEAFLEKRHSFFPYLFLLFPAVFLSIAVGVGVGTGTWRRTMEVWPAFGGWYELQPETRIGDRRTAALGVAVGWHLFGVLAWGHYFQVAERPYDLMASITTVVYELLGMVPVGFVAYYLRLGRNLRDARVLLNRAPCTLGDDLTVRVEQDVLTLLSLEELSVALTCEETVCHRSGSKRTVSSHDCYEDRASLLRDRQVMAGETISAERTFHVPDDGVPSSPEDFKGYPRHAWWIKVVSKVSGQPDYRAKFPLTVSSCGSDSHEGAG